jgi:hypothetical protein
MNDLICRWVSFKTYRLLMTWSLRTLQIFSKPAYAHQKSHVDIHGALGRLSG